MNETLRPERVRAMRYVARRGTQAPLGQIQERLTAAFRKLDSGLAAVTAEGARQHPAAGGWCIQEVVDHLFESNQLALSELEDLLAGRNPSGGPIPAALQSAAALALSWDEAREALALLHRRIEERVSAAEESIPLSARAAVAMVVQADEGSELIEWVEELDWKAYVAVLRIHVLEHVAQIERIRRSVADELSVRIDPEQAREAPPCRDR